MMERMRMIKPNIALAFLLTGLLAACGGDSGDSVVPETGTGTGTGDDGTTGTVDNGDGSTDDITTGTNITNPRLGSGTGASYAPQLTTSLTSLPVGGSTNISATIVDSDRNNAKVVSKLYGIRFSSGCSQSVPPKASFSKDEVITSGGEVTVTYTAEGCSTGTDTVTFSLFNVADGAISGDKPLHSLTTTLTIARPDVQSISYVGNSSPAIGLAGIGNSVLPTVSDVTFRVIDVNGNPLEGTAVSFELSPENSLAVISPAQQTTGPNGEVKVSVSSGSVQATVRVKATATTNAGELIEVESSPIAIVKGLVQQIGFSLSADVFNPNAFSKDGTA